MKSYTYGSTEGIDAVVNALPDHYNMNLNTSDMTKLVMVLWRYWNGYADENEGEADWAGDCLSTIAETLGIEWI